MAMSTMTELTVDGKGVVTFRCDASLAIGTGHIMRCLTLADELVRSGVRCLFICRTQPGDMSGEISRRGHEIITLPSIDGLSGSGNSWLGITQERDAEETIQALGELEESPDWLVVDHYGMDVRWELLVKPFAGQLMVIDDLANRSHDCRLLLDQNLYDRMALRYEQLVPSNCTCLLGPRYALLRDEFRRVRAYTRTRTGDVRRLLVVFGGVDAANLTSRALESLESCVDLGLIVDVVIGKANPHKTEIQRRLQKLSGLRLHIQTDDMASLMNAADLSIGAGGTTTWERAYLGLPCLTVVVAENQREMTDAAARAGSCVNLGWHEQVTAQDMTTAIREACAFPQRIRKISKQALSLSAPDHQTGTTDVAARMLQLMRVPA